MQLWHWWNTIGQNVWDIQRQVERERNILQRVIQEVMPLWFAARSWTAESDQIQSWPDLYTATTRFPACPTAKYAKTPFLPTHLAQTSFTYPIPNCILKHSRVLMNIVRGFHLCNLPSLDRVGLMRPENPKNMHNWGIQQNTNSILSQMIYFSLPLDFSYLNKCCYQNLGLVLVIVLLTANFPTVLSEESWETAFPRMLSKNGAAQQLHVPAPLQVHRWLYSCQAHRQQTQNVQ